MMGPENLLEGDSEYVQVANLKIDEPRVIVARDKNDRLVAMKCFPGGLTEERQKSLLREILVQSTAHHHCVTGYIELHEFNGCLFLVTEYVSPVTLKDEVDHPHPQIFQAGPYHAVLLRYRTDAGHRERQLRRRGLEEEVAKKWFCDVVFGVIHLRDKGVAYREVQAEHVLLTEDKSRAKINNFRFSRFGSHNCRSRVGVPYYMAPEIWLRNPNDNSEYNGEESDVWSLGVLLFFMLFQCFPFEVPDNGRSDEERFRDLGLAVTQSQLYIEPNPAEISEGCRTLLEQMLQRDPEQRICLDQIRANAWFSYPEPEALEPNPANLNQDIDAIRHMIANAGNYENV